MINEMKNDFDDRGYQTNSIQCRTKCVACSPDACEGSPATAHLHRVT